MLPDDITQAVLARKDVAFRGGHGQSEAKPASASTHLDELRTTQRYPIYRALSILYPILRKVDRIEEHVCSRSRRRRPDASSTCRTTSHLDYLPSRW